MWWKEGYEKFSFSKYVKLHLNFSRNKTEALVILKRLKCPWDDRRDANFIAPLRIHL